MCFQHGPVREHGRNGLTEESLLAVVIDRLESHQRGEYACPENAAALDMARKALAELLNRTAKRAARGVEGTSAV